MYETTGDKAYLYAFMKEATKIIRSRRDFSLSSSFLPLWCRRVTMSGTSDGYANHISFNFNGRILWVLAHFNYIIASDATLKTTRIALYGNEDRMQLYNGAETFGEYQTWMEPIITETLNYVMNVYMWNVDFSCYSVQGVGHDFENERLGAFNYQAPWANAFLYMYISNNSKYYDYGVRAVKIAETILGNACNTLTAPTTLVQLQDLNVG